MTSPAKIEIEHLTYKYDDGTESLIDVSLSIAANQITALFGPAGGGKSVCNGDCAVKWPPLMADASAQASGDFTIVTRDNGSKQWAYKGKPLYTWPEDQEPGDKYGDNYNKVWHIVK